jgi:hypothetical protein
MVYCESPDFVFPLQADIFYPSVEQSGYGIVQKNWMLDKTIAGNFTTSRREWTEEVKPKMAITQNSLITGRTKTDLRISSKGVNNSVTNVIITNIRDASGNHIYLETSGPRVGKSTIFEIATIQPFVGPFGSTEYYDIVLRRSENQAVDV